MMERGGGSAAARKPPFYIREMTREVEGGEGRGGERKTRSGGHEVYFSTLSVFFRCALNNMGRETDESGNDRIVSRLWWFSHFLGWYFTRDHKSGEYKKRFVKIQIGRVTRCLSYSYVRMAHGYTRYARTYTRPYNSGNNEVHSSRIGRVRFIIQTLSRHPYFAYPRTSFLMYDAWYRCTQSAIC